jgi:hypothetical protein
LKLALETYISLVCPDAPSLAAPAQAPAEVYRRGPRSAQPHAHARYGQRDRALKQMFSELGNRIALVHFKDFRLAPDGASYQLPGPLKGEMNYRLFAEQVAKLPEETPLIAEHLKPPEFAAARKELLPLLEAAERRMTK